MLQRHCWVTISVVALLLFATSGMAISRMTCLMSGHTLMALGLLEDCCPEPEQADGATVSPVCCLFGQATADVEPFVPVAGPEFVPVLVANGPMSAPQVPVLHRSATADEFGRPPPISATHRLVLHATFRI